MKNWNYYLTTTFALAGCIMIPAAKAQDAEAEAPAAEEAAPAAENIPGVTTDPAAKDIKLDPNVSWVSFIVNDGRMQSNRDYFGAIRSADLTALEAGSKDGMVRVQQVFYYNPATRQFSRFDAAAGGATPILQQSGYFRADSIMRIVPLNEDFVKNLISRKFLTVNGE